MPSQAPYPTTGAGWVADADALAASLRTVYDELSPYGAMAGATRPAPGSGTRPILLAAASVLAAVRDEATSEFGSSRVSLVAGTGGFVPALSAMEAQARNAIDDTTDILDGTTPPTGSGLLTLILIGGPADSLTAGSAETAAGVTTAQSPEAGFDEVTDPSVDAAVWRDSPGDHGNNGGTGPGYGLVSPLDDPYIGSGNRPKQGSNWPELARLLCTQYQSPGGQPPRVRILMPAKGGSVLPIEDEDGGWGGDPTADPPTPGLYDYLHEQGAAFFAAVRAEAGYDPAHEVVVSLHTFNNEADLLVDDAATPTGNQIRETDYADEVAGVPAKLTSVLADVVPGLTLDASVISVAGGYANDPQRANMLRLRAMQQEGVTRSSGALSAEPTDVLRQMVLDDAALLDGGGTNLNTDDKDNLHPSLHGNRRWAAALATHLASLLSLTPAA